MVDGLDDGLAAVLGATEIANLTRLSGGASRDTWRFEADGRRLILQRQREGDVRDMATEIAAVRAAAAADVPTARIVAASTDVTQLGAAYMILTDVAGETTPRKILRDDQYERARILLPRQLAEALVKVHAIDPAAIPGLIETDQVTQYREVLDTLAQPHPTFELALRWLDGNRPPFGDRGVVHGDFRLGNVIVGDDGLRAVLDWELVHIGDPMEDLGWLCVKA
ncbi:MAG: phosphotransferase family protein, partial [Ilumatobacteraceae bacterium]|nr:phosphotransferase family protein [Ilumatobacteraceae bacterium]